MSNELLPLSGFKPVAADLPKWLVVALAYALTAKIVLGFYSDNGIISIVWPCSGLALVALIVAGKRCWPGVFAGALLGNMLAGSPFHLSFFIAIGNTLEALTCLLLLQHKDRFDATFDRVRDYRSLVEAGAIGSVVSAVNGCVALWLSDVLSDASFLYGLRTWWQGDFLGIVLVAPLLLIWRRWPGGWFTQNKSFETAGFLVLTFLVGQIVFLDWLHDSVGLIARGYWMFLFVIWGAVSFGRQGATLVIGVVAVQALVGAAQHTGFFRTDIAETGLSNFWFYTLTLSAVGLLLAIHNTQRKQAEEHLARYNDQLEQEVRSRTAELVQARDAAEAANRAKSLFLANMSHELRTPLNAILGFSQLMVRNEHIPENELERLHIINRSGEHLLQLINDVLDMSRIEAGRVQLEERDFDLGNMVRVVVDMMRVRAESKGLQLLLEQSSQFPRSIHGDEAKLRQILINLIGNAVKFTMQGGVHVRLGTRQNDRRHLFIEIEDSGPGIDPADQARIFEPFAQLGEYAVNVGTGLGLTITRQFVTLMGGAIAVESRPGEGSLFRVELPLRPAAHAVVEAALPAKGQVSGLAPDQPQFRILIAEDQPENYLLLTSLMERIGIPYKLAENGAQAVELFESWQPHLILMDQRMPVMDGLSATRAIRRLPNGAEVKIVAVTASVFSEKREEMMQAGMDGFVPKPYRAEEIYDCLARYLGVRYTHAEMRENDDAAPAAPITPEMVAVLPADLRREMSEALRLLEIERIDSAIAQVASFDPRLHKQLLVLAESFDYSAILKILEATR